LFKPKVGLKSRGQRVDPMKPGLIQRGIQTVCSEMAVVQVLLWKYEVTQVSTVD